MQFSGIYAITDDRLLPGERLFSAAAAALQGGEYSLPLIIDDDVQP